MSELINTEVLPTGSRESERDQSIIQLGPELTFADIIGGRIPITLNSLVLDRSGVQIDTADLLSHVETDTQPGRVF